MPPRLTVGLIINDLRQKSSGVGFSRYMIYDCVFVVTESVLCLYEKKMDLQNGLIEMAHAT